MQTIYDLILMKHGINIKVTVFIVDTNVSKSDKFVRPDQDDIGSSVFAALLVCMNIFDFWFTC